ncbi:hypothetical protein [Rhodoblastus sp.]|uniref:hypothetical protein n=1 Tax=Rhodoblastus sp. TaxID=1962975 RepID=UPI0025E84E21|nr:hypothetical protein [Rhodoblastus sp.]
MKPLAKSIPDSASRARAKIANLLAAQQARPSRRTTTKSQIERASDFGHILPFGLRLLAAVVEGFDREFPERVKIACSGVDRFLPMPVDGAPLRGVPKAGARQQDIA